MTKWQEQLKKRAKNGDQEADDILWETREMSDNELARYLAENDEHVRSVLRLSSLAEKDAMPDLNKEYYEMLSKGQKAFNVAGKADATGFDKPKSLDEWMEIFGVEATSVGPDGKKVYGDDDRAAFTNPDNPKYFKKIKTPDQLKEIASWQGFDGNTDLLADHVSRASDMFQNTLRVEGWTPDNKLDVINFITSTLKGAAFPRVKEAQLDGREISWQDMAGDLAELGLNFVPGYGLVSKAGKLIARVPAGLMRGAVKGAITGAEASAVPVGAQAIDMALYDEGPRSEWDWKRVGSQAGTMGVGMLGAGTLVKQGRRQMLPSEGASVANADAARARGFLGSIGEKTDDIIAQRQAMLDRKADLAKQRANVSLEGDTDIRTANVEAPKWQDVADAENYRIMTEEAKRLARSEEERKAYNALAIERKEELARRKNATKGLDRDQYLRARSEQYWADPDNPPMKRMSDMPEGTVLWNPMEQIPANPGFVKTRDSQGNILTVKQEDIDLFAEPTMEKWPEVDRAVAERYMKANEAGARDIVQLPDGRLVYKSSLKDGNYVVGDPAKGGYTVDFGTDLGGRADELRFMYPVEVESAPAVPAKGSGVPSFLDEIDAIRANKFRTDKPADRGYGLGDVKDRNQTVKKAIQNSRDEMLIRKMEGGGNRMAETARDAGAAAPLPQRPGSVEVRRCRPRQGRCILELPHEEAVGVHFLEIRPEDQEEEFRGRHGRDGLRPRQRAHVQVQREPGALPRHRGEAGKAGVEAPERTLR